MSDPSNEAPPRCVAETRKKPTHYSAPHTYRCMREAGHDGLHEWVEPGVEGRHRIIWDGPARKQEDNTRWRYGLEYVR